MKSSAIAVSAALCLAVSPVAAQTLNAKEVFESWIGKPLNAETPQGVKFQVLFATDGTARLSGGLTDQGKWRGLDDGYCAVWQKIRPGTESCFTIVADGPTAYLVVFKDSGQVSSRVVK
jgi:hypothetical protein